MNIKALRAGVIVIGAVAACLGPVSHLLGTLAVVNGDGDRAVSLCEKSVQSCADAGSQPWLARSD